MGIQTEGTKKRHINTVPKEEKEDFKKEPRRYLDNLPEGFTVVSMDESFFFYDSIVRRVWIYKNNRPVVRVTGSHKHSCLIWCISLEGKQIFDGMIDLMKIRSMIILKQIHYKFPKCYLFLDKAPQHYKSQKVREYFEKHKDVLIPVWLPTASPEFMVLEEYWNISKNDLLVLKYYK